MTDQPTPAEIRHFVESFRTLDRDTAIMHYVRTRQALHGAPDETVVKVLCWLDQLSVDA